MEFVPLVKKLAEGVKAAFQETPEEMERRHTKADRAKLYGEMRSFSDFLPYSEWLVEEQMILMDDLVSVGAMWEIEMVPTEAVKKEQLENVEEAINDALGSINLNYLSEGQYVLSTYTVNDYTLAHDLEEIKTSIHPKWRGTPLADAYIDSMAKMFKGLESEKGLFQEGAEGSTRPFRGGRRIPRMMLYRRVPMAKRKGAEAIRQREITELKQLRATLEDALGGQGIKLQRMSRESFYEFMVRWFNPRPASTDGSINDLLAANPCPSEELTALDGEYAMSFLFNSPRTDSETGVVWFDECPSRFIQVDRIAKVPKPAVVTAEIAGANKSDFAANFDLLPPGCMFVKHIYFQTQEEANERVNYIESKSRFIDDKAARVNEEAHRAKEELAKDEKLFKVEMGFYVTALTKTGLEEKSRKVSSLASQKMGLGVIAPKNNLFPVESYLRNMPFVPDPMLDNRRRRGRLSWLRHSISLLPMQGRKRGNESPGSKRCMTTFNRGGEVLNIDPLNKESNAHMVLLGPTGTGKSATLNKGIIELLLFHDARLVIAEAGMSFDPIMDFLEAQQADVQRININAGKLGRPIAPFANARKAREKLLQDMKKRGMSESQLVETTVAGIPTSEFVDYEGKDEDELDDETKGRLSEIREQVANRVREALSEQEGEQALEKDYLGECVMIAKIMVTGGDAKEEAAFRKRDATHLGKAIIASVTIADAQNEDLVRPEHVVKALRQRANDKELKLSEKMRDRIQEMADCMDDYCEPGSVRSDVLNREAKPFKKCDCLHVELGIAQRDGYEDVLALAYLGLLNNINDIAERKELEGDNRPIYVITDEAHLILKHQMIAPVAIKIVRMWRKYGAWFLPATQDTTSFKGGAEAILVIGEMFICLSPPEDEIEALTKLLALSEEQQAMIRSAKMQAKKYTEGVYINRQRKSATLFRMLQPSFCLSVAGTDSKEKEARAAHMRKYGVRTAGAVLIEAAYLDKFRGIIDDTELEEEIQKIVNDPRYKATA